MEDILRIPEKDLTQALETMPTPRNPYDSSVWSDGIHAFMANRAYKRRGKPVINIQSEHPEVIKLRDALQNRQLKAATKKTAVIGLRLLYGSKTGGVLKPEFDLEESVAIYDAEPYVSAAIRRQLNIWFKQEFRFTSTDKRIADYLNQRFMDMAFVTDIPTKQLFKMIVRDLLKFSNAFVVKHRDKVLSGIAKFKPGRPAPVAGYFPVAAINMFPRFNNGRLVSWIRYLDDGTMAAELDPRDVIHFTFEREPDFLFGKPRTLGAVEDIAALRRIEENVEVLLQKYLFPLFQLTVGTPEAPAQYLPDGTSEVEVGRMMLEEMQQEGMLIGTERHKLEVVGAKGAAMDASKYIQHFKSRVMTALGVSPLDMGEGDTANRSTADNISQNLKERVLDDQNEFACQVIQFMVAELLLEHPEDISVPRNLNKVRLHFPEVDVDNKIKKENHSLNLWNNNIITEDEMREDIGKLPMSEEERSKTHFSLIDVPMAIISAVDEPFTQEAKSAVKARTKADTVGVTSGPATKNNQPAKSKPGTGVRSGGRPAGAKKKKGTPASRAPQAATTPSNQFGTNPGPTKAKSSFERGLVGIRLSNFISIATLTETQEELENAVNERFEDDELRKILKDTISKLDWNTIDRTERRSALVSELMVHADRFKDDEESS
jgi:hypothetical protein